MEFFKRKYNLMNIRWEYGLICQAEERIEEKKWKDTKMKEDFKKLNL